MEDEDRDAVDLLHGVLGDAELVRGGQDWIFFTPFV